MCGIAGIWQIDGADRRLPDIIRPMTTVMSHRGPDDEGYLLVNSGQQMALPCAGPDTTPELQLPPLDDLAGQPFDLALGFRRLSILDLSPAGHQPMQRHGLWLLFNGEIYNYIELRRELQAKGYAFESGTDSEVILAAYREWGIDCLNRFNGMWAFVIWDGVERRLFCARDRFGIKPFYYIWDGRRFAFASEIKALLQLPDLERRPNDAIIHDYLRYNRLDHTPDTFFAGIKRLPPAHYLTVKPGALSLQRYWELDPYYKREVSDPAEAVAEFRRLFYDSVRLRLRSDVAVGTCLSGGLDSSAIVCAANDLLFKEHLLQQDLVGNHQKTFSACSNDKRFDEREFIQPVLAATGAEPNYTFPDVDGLMSELERLVWHQDEPFMSTSMYAQWQVMKLTAGRGVTVLLDGQGGDELLAGYHTYFDYFWGMLLQSGQWGQLGREWQAYRALYGSGWLPMVARTSRAHLPVSLLSLGRQYKQGGVVGMSQTFARQHTDRVFEFTYRGSADPLHAFLADTLTRISVPMLLRFEDRNSMAHAIESRIPFLDYRLVEYVYSLPVTFKINHGLTKVVLRRAFEGIMPDKVRQRTGKMGFVTPESIWLSTGMKDWTQEIIHSRSFKERPYFDVPLVQQAFTDHLAGKRDLDKIAWRWLNLELWLRKMIDSEVAPVAPVW
jgi:asparagine synthase (glutamine-hydrolysing)